jgi:glycosyltransferase involved in cell wall biosynthesis
MLVGGLDPNPAGISQAQLDIWRREGIIDYQGELRDVRPALAQSHVYVLPSYREGTPRTVLEAMAMRRAVITTTAPGCRETIVDGVSGYLVPPRSAEALADRMMEFIRSPQLVSQMADASLARVKEKFEAGAVARDTAGLVLGEITR